jgi:hypothetical protein
MAKVDLGGQRFGRLVVLARSGGCSKWSCACDCGTAAVVSSWNLKNGKTRSCGCLRDESKRRIKTTHGMSYTREYQSWEQMRVRCENQASPAYKWYGGRGISVCDRWRSFENFYEDMGARPPATSLDRIDSNGNYEPWNCRWADSKRQQRNRTNNRIETYGGVTAPVSELCERFGVNHFTVRSRMAAGAPIEIAMSVGRLPRGTIKKELKEKA